MGPALLPAPLSPVTTIYAASASSVAR